MENLEADKTELTSLLERSFIAKDGCNLHLDKLADALLEFDGISGIELEKAIEESKGAFDKFGMSMLEITPDLLHPSESKFAISRTLAEAYKVIEICECIRTFSEDLNLNLEPIAGVSDIYQVTRICELVNNYLYGLQSHIPLEKWITHIAMRSLNFGEGIRESGNTRKRLGQFACSYRVQVESTIKKVNLELSNPINFKNNPIQFANAVNYIKVLSEYRNSLEMMESQNFRGM